MITAKNYVAQAEKALKETNNVHKDVVNTMLYIIKNSEHFAIPDEGRLLNDKIKGLIDVSLNLPYDNMTVEYYKDSEVEKRVIFASQDDKYIFISCAGYYKKLNKWKFSNCIMTVKRNSKCTNEGIVYDIIFPENFENNFTDNQLESEEMFTKNLSFYIFELLEALTCKNVYTELLEPIDEKKNERRIKQGKLPIYETKILVIDTKPKEIDTTWKGGTHASPRQHLRRGHIRRYSWGNIWINNMIVGKAENGKVDKSYAVK